MKKLFALVDGNCFYASCERIFNPKYKGRPLVVLSNNDGCAVTRTDEAKQLWVKMWDPYFKIRNEFWDRVICKSSNYMLYWEISRRFHYLVGLYASWQEIYSIDESFLDFSMVPDVSHTSAQIYARCKRDLWLPVCVWVWSTKTRAKFANFLAKKNSHFRGRCNLEEMEKEEVEKFMRVYDVWEVWWVWRRNKDRLNALGIYSIYDLQQAQPQTMRSIFSVVMEKTVRELNGESCLELEEIGDKKKQIMTSRSFGKHVDTIAWLQSAITYFCMRGWEKLRKQESRAWSITVFVQSNRFRQDHKQYNNSYTLWFPVPTEDSGLLIKAAIQGLKHIFLPWIQYKKAWILLSNLESWIFEQVTLFWESTDPGRKKLMETLDRLNGKYGKDTMWFASRGNNEDWVMKCDNKSPDYLHNWKNVPVCR